jgi:hypothetical protein
LLEIDNSAAERALRAVAFGRKNYLFVGSDCGGERAALQKDGAADQLLLPLLKHDFWGCCQSLDSGSTTCHRASPRPNQVSDYKSIPPGRKTGYPDE